MRLLMDVAAGVWQVHCSRPVSKAVIQKKVLDKRAQERLERLVHVMCISLTTTSGRMSMCYFCIFIGQSTKITFNTQVCDSFGPLFTSHAHSNLWMKILGLLLYCCFVSMPTLSTVSFVPSCVFHISTTCVHLLHVPPFISEELWKQAHHCWIKGPGGGGESRQKVGQRGESGECGHSLKC